MPEQPEQTWEHNEELLRKINQNLQSLKTQTDKYMSKRILESVILLAEVVGALNEKLKP